MKPDRIEALSFDIIDSEAGPHTFSQRQWAIVRRMIHTSADFELMQTVRFHPRAIDAGVAALRRGCTVYTDTNMARVGIRRLETERFGVAVDCRIADPAVGRTAAENGATRAEAAVDAVADRIDGNIYAVGNAPTALLRLVALMEKGTIAPALVIGLPVGFVNAAESKDALVALDRPHIAVVGRKGGSNLAAAAVNALLKLALQDG